MSPWGEDEYRDSLKKGVDECYSIAKECRKLGLDVSGRVEIPLANDMADRVEELIEIKGISREIRELSREMSREEVSLQMSRNVAMRYREQGSEIALDKAIRTGLAILTEGILVAPLEGISTVKVGKNYDGTNYVSVVYAGPIRGAGGTAQAMSVLIADIVRRELGIGKFVATDDEVERYIEEIQAYNRVKHLQYLPDREEIRRVVKNCPVCIDGEGSEDEEISGHRDMERFPSNKIRGGMCLVLCEGLLQKSKKVLKHTEKLGIKDWEFLNASVKDESSTSGSKSSKFLNDIVAGRPVFSHPGRPGGFRLRYGRSRLSGLAAASINPVTMFVLKEFVATGSQLKVELPGKAAAITPCDEIEGPMVLTKDGSHIRVRSVEQATSLKDKIDVITDIGEILISYGDFLENNHVLERPPFSVDYWNILASKVPEELRKPSDASAAVEISKKYSVPLHPEFNYFWHDITCDEVDVLGSIIAESIRNDAFPAIAWSSSTEDILMRLGVEFAADKETLMINNGEILRIIFRNFTKGSVEHIERTSSYISSISGIEIRDRSPTRIGARLGRPEKAGDRKMKPMVHTLFPIEISGNSRRSISDAARKKTDIYRVETDVRVCRECGTETPAISCPDCGKITEDTEKVGEVEIDIRKIFESAMRKLKLEQHEVKEFKGVKRLMSGGKYCEPVEKGLLRTTHGISLNKDGTCRYDMSDVPITHFTCSEIRLPEKKAAELGYSDGMNEIFTQDLIIPWDCAEYMFRVSKFVDDLLVKYYGTEPYYNCVNPEDLIGHLVIGLAPHTSGGILGRIIGFSSVNGCYAHPFYHAAKRRNCDGDEDSIMLLMDGLLNFSRKFLPKTTGGLMDAPLVMTLFLKPDEVDKEALNVDSSSTYPMEFYEAAERMAKPSEIEKVMSPMKVMVEEKGTARGMGYMFSTADLNNGVILSSYKKLGSMGEKIKEQLDLARSIRAVDANDVASRLINSHFLPDMFGNFRGFFSQEFRCTKCNTKFRRVPLSGKCTKCGEKSITLTIHRGGIVKYLNETKNIMNTFKLEDSMMYRLENLFRTIEDSFNGLSPEEVDDRDAVNLDQYEEDMVQ